MLSGRAADLFGGRRTFVAGLLLFSLASLLGGTAASRQVLVGARALQGLGGAAMAASSLAIITSSFAAGPERHRAIGLWGAMNGAGGATGTLLGGIITQELSWRWVLLINLPIGIVAALIARAVVVDRRRERRRRQLRPRRRAGGHRRAARARLRDRQRRRARLGLARGARPDRARHRSCWAAFVVIEGRFAAGAAGAAAGVREPPAAGVQHRRPPVQRGALPDVVLRLAATCRKSCTSDRSTRASRSCRWRSRSWPAPPRPAGSSGASAPAPCSAAGLTLMAVGLALFAAHLRQRRLRLGLPAPRAARLDRCRPLGRALDDRRDRDRARRRRRVSPRAW